MTGVTESDAVPPEGEPGIHRLRVRYCETDQMGVAHHGSYIDWFEEARTEWLRQRGKSYAEHEADGILLQVVEVGVQYKRSVRYDDLIDIETRIVERKRASITLGYRVTRVDDGTQVVDAHTTLACVGRDGKLRRLPVL